MIDGFLNGLRRTGERVQRRGEEVAQAARLRLEIFQLGRELDALYARLGRAYHGNASVSTLEEVRGEIKRVDEEIAAREKLMTEIGADLQGKHEADATRALDLTKKASPDALNPPADAQTALNVWKEKEAARMTDPSQLRTGPETDATGRPDGENADPTRAAGGNSHASPYASPDGRATNPNEAGNPEKLRPTDNTASMGNEAARDEMVRHDNQLKEGERATRDPDPLASKD